MHEGNGSLHEQMRSASRSHHWLRQSALDALRTQAFDELQRCRDEYGMVGLKIYSTPETSIAEPAMIPILEKCVDSISSYSPTQPLTNANT